MNKVNYFEALARLRQIIPAGLTDVSLQALHSPDIIKGALSKSNIALTELALYDDSLEPNLENAFYRLKGELYVTNNHTYVCHVDMFKDLDLAKKSVLSEETIIVSKEQPRILIFQHDKKLFFVDTGYSREELESAQNLAFSLREQQLITKKKAWQSIPKEHVCAIQTLLLKPDQKLKAARHVEQVMGLEVIEARDFVNDLKPWWPADL